MAELKLQTEFTDDGRFMAIAYEQWGNNTVVQDVEIVKDQAEAEKWFAEVSTTQPWRPRS